jgi:hypothetical protein
MEASFHLKVVCNQSGAVTSAFSGIRLFPKISCVAKLGAWTRFSALTAKQMKPAPVVIKSAANS